MATFADKNPNIFMHREITVSVWRIEGHTASFWFDRVWPETEDGKEKAPQPPDRTYPDREMFPGSIMQFLGSGTPHLFYRHDSEDEDENEDEERDGGESGDDSAQESSESGEGGDGEESGDESAQESSEDVDMSTHC